MKKFLVSIMLAAAALSALPAADAKPMGGGRTFGRQSQNVARQAPPATPAPAPRPAATPTPPLVQPAIVPRPASPWRGMLGGALLGLGLGALFTHFGMGAGMASALGTILMLGLLMFAVVFIVRMFRAKREPQTVPYTGGFSGFTAAPPSNTPSNILTPDFGASRIAPVDVTPASTTALLDKPGASWGIPDNFDTAGFLRNAKSSFIRMQAAWDKADVNDLREFTTPEVFAELRMQIQERGASGDFTDVVAIEAELLGIELIGGEQLASVKFTGMIKTAPAAPAEPFAEVWNMAKPIDAAGGWMLAGIQQLS